MKKLRILLLAYIQALYLFDEVKCQEQGFVDTRYATEGKGISLPCSIPDDATYLKWKFQRNGTNYIQDAAQVFPGNIPSIFDDFKGRADLQGGSLVIHTVEVKDEGHYWCEISMVNVPTAYSKKYPVHVYVTPQEPLLTPLGNSTLTEYKNKTVARCSSQGGKPGSSILWFNGTRPMSTIQDVIYTQNTFKDYLTDGTVDLFLKPTRFDHGRSFSCVIDHPAYEGSKKVLNYTVQVMYHPINIRIWANLTSKYIYCHAESFPAPTYHWVMPGDLSGFTGDSLYIEDLFNLPGYEYFVCTASNGIPPNATAKVKVDDLVYPDGKPGWLGLEWWVWGAILGGIAAFIIIVVIIICCYVRRNKSSGKKKATKYTKPIKKPIVGMQDTTPLRPASLQVDMNSRTPDGREDSFDSRTPTPPHPHKAMLIGGLYSKSQENVTLIPNEELRRSRDNVFTGNRRSVHASMEQLDVAASHIQTLNKSWDQLSKSRQQLNEAQGELQYASPNVRKSREELYHSQEALNREDDQNYPYIDDGTTRSNEYYPTHDGRDYDQHDGYRGDPPGYDEPGYGDSKQGYADQGYGYQQEGYDTYRDGSQYDQGNTYDRSQNYDQRNAYNDRQDQYSGYDNGYQDRGGYDYRDDGRDYRYQDDQYNNQYQPKRIV